LKRQLIWLIPIVIVLLVAAGYFGIRLYRELTASVQVEAPQGPGASVPVPHPTLQPETKNRVSQRLLEAGLNEEPVLGDTAVSGHIRRLENGETSLTRLWQYLKDIEYLNAYTAEHGGAIPAAFWDVRTPELEASGWDEYSIVHQIVVPEAEPYLHLLTQGYGRFLQFKAAEASAEDTALDAALDMFAYVDDYWTAVTATSPEPDGPEALKGVADSKLMVWQSLVAGSTRINPLTHEPMFSHSIFARDNVGTMYQYDVGEEISIAEVWGVTGFAPHFVGIPENNNQVEHMSISMVLQIVLGEPVQVLDGIEEEKVLAGHADSGEANADMALNNAIHKEFAPNFAEDWETAVEHLRCVLKSENKNSDC
jgi:hypothetical protein